MSMKSTLKTQEQIMEKWNSPSPPLVSICCITFNHENFIRDALDGFLSQETNFPFEIIVRDDASQDNTPQILMDYQATYPDIVQLILEQENQYSKGVRPFPVVFKEAKGKYLAMCEGDDYWINRKKLQVQFDYMEEHRNYSMCFHNSQRIGLGYEYEFSSFCQQMKESYGTSDIIRSGWIAPTQSLFLKKECMENVPASFDRVYNGDYAIQLICSTFGRIGYIDSIMSVYRAHAGGASKMITEYSCIQEIIKLLNIFDRYTNGKYSSPIARRKFVYTSRMMKWKLRGIVRQVVNIARS